MALFQIRKLLDNKYLGFIMTHYLLIMAYQWYGIIKATVMRRPLMRTTLTILRHGILFCVVPRDFFYFASYVKILWETIIIYNIWHLNRIRFDTPHILTPKGEYSACCHYRRKTLLKHIAIMSCQSPHDSIAAHGASNPRPFGYESYALTNCAITAYKPAKRRPRSNTELHLLIIKSHPQSVKFHATTKNMASKCALNHVAGTIVMMT